MKKQTKLKNILILVIITILFSTYLISFGESKITYKQEIKENTNYKQLHNQKNEICKRIDMIYNIYNSSNLKTQKKYIYKNFEKISSHKNISFYTVENTKSMEPTLNNNSMLLVYKGDFKKEIGDIILFKEKNKTIAHRIIEIKKNKIITKGDNNNSFEEINKNQIIGLILAYNN